MRDEKRRAVDGIGRAGGHGRERLYLGAAILLAAINLRPAVASVGPVLDDIRASIGLSATGASALTALPVLCFGAGALLAPRLSRHFGAESILGAVMALTAGGLLLRIIPVTPLLFVGTLLAGGAIAMANVLIPAIVKRDFERRTGPVMGLYVSVMGAAAAVAAGLTVPIAAALPGGWRAGLGVWAVPAAVASAWWAALAAARRRRPIAVTEPEPLPGSLLRDPIAWQVTGFMGLQSLSFYTLLSWLPSMYRSFGLDPDAAGHLLSLLVLLGIPASLLAPVMVTRGARQSAWAGGAVGLTAAGILGLLLAPTLQPQVWVVLAGVGMGTSFPLALTLVVLRSQDSTVTGQLSAMSQSVGYLLAAAGPFLFGFLNDRSGGWTLPLMFLLVLTVPQLLCGLLAGRPRYVGGR